MFYLRMGFEDVGGEDEEKLTPISGVMELKCPETLSDAAKMVTTASEIKKCVTKGTAMHKKKAGKPSNLKELSKATISDSVEEWETTVCFLQTAFSGKKVLGPTNAAKMPVVLLEVEVQSAKDASENNMMQSLSAVSPIQPCKQ